MKRPWQEDTGALPWLFLLVLILGFGVLFKNHYLTKEAIKSDKDFYAALSSVATLFFLMIGGALSYIRFFKGRTLRSKINLELKTGIISLNDNFLHWVEVEIKNSGSVTIWHYQTQIIAVLRKNSITCKVDVTDFIPSYDPNSGIPLIDAGESSYEHAFLEVPKEVDVASFQVTITDKYNHQWTRSITSKNSESKPAT
jgi:hypothetical protein